MIYGQGDVTVVREDRPIPEGLTPRRVTLAIGEETAHSHVLDDVIEWTDGGVRYVAVLVPTVMRVEGQPWRHDPIELPPGVYRVIDHQIEYTPTAIVRSTD